MLAAGDEQAHRNREERERAGGTDLGYEVELCERAELGEKHARELVREACDRQQRGRGELNGEEVLALSRVGGRMLGRQGIALVFLVEVKALDAVAEQQDSHGGGDGAEHEGGERLQKEVSHRHEV